MPSTRCFSSSPRRTFSDASNSSTGLRVMIEIAPAALLRPNSVPCGPFSTSMRSMSLKASSEEPERAEYTPST